MIMTANVSQTACQVPGSQHLDPALAADEPDGTDPVPVSERKHQDADKRNKCKGDEHEQRRKHQDAKPTLRGARRPALV
jgi:hypothetical protein